MSIAEIEPFQEIGNGALVRKTKSKDKQCVVCGAAAICKHFTAFFRRTVSSQQRYTCSRDKTCEISANNKTFCKSCRLKLCVKNGMSFSAVCSAKRISMLTNVSTDSILWKFVILQRATYLNRYQSIINSYGGNQKLALIGTENPTCLQSSIAIASEISVMLDYIRSSPLYQIGLEEDEFLEFSKALCFPWIAFQQIIHTMRNLGFKQNVVYCVDESFLTVKDDIVLTFVKTSQNLRDPQTVAKFTKDYFEAILTSSSRFHAGRFEDFELASIFHIFALQLAIRIFPQHTDLKFHLNELFSELQKQYDDNFDDCALRLANIVLMVGEINELVQIYSNYITVLELHGYKPVFSLTLGSSVLLINHSNENFI